jgi:hypothetical protein
LGRVAALRECLQKSGITLPERAPGRGLLGGLLGRSSRLPKGVTPAQLRAALQKCGFLRGFGGARRRLNDPVFKQALARFAACMRENGVNVPEPNTSGNGPVFDTKGLSTQSPQFRVAEAKCRQDLRAGFGPGAGRGAGGATG